MTQTRSLLFIAWLFLAGWLWLQWTEFDAAPAAGTPVAGVAPGAMPSAPAAPAVDAGTLPAAATALPSAAALPGAPPGVERLVTPIVRVRNDVLELDIDERGNIVGSRLLGYREKKNADSPELRLLAIEPGRRYTASAGLIEKDDAEQPRELQPAFRPVASTRDFALAPGVAALRVPLEWVDPASGLTVRRTLHLDRGSYLLRVEDTYINAGTAARLLYPFVDIARTAPPPPPKWAALTNPETFSFSGPAWYTPEEKYNKTPFTDFENEAPPQAEVQGGWIGMLQHYFVAAWLPDKKEKQIFSLAQVDVDGVPLYRIRSIATPMHLAPGAQATRQSRLWVGPKLQKQLVAIDPELNLNRTLDYGILHFISQPLFDYVLRPLHALTGNWGWAIVLTVLLLKLALYPLSAKQFKSMAKMRDLAPRMEALKERYGAGQEYQVAMMELYKKEKINPVSGCLPILIPLPIFFALYWVLLETVELRHAPWIGWIQNLTAPDPYFILPALNLGVMYLTQKMAPTPGMDPMQKKMMQMMPLVFGVLMAFFPAGLVLYWVSNGLLGLLQQWWMYRQHGKGPGARPAPAH